MALNRGHENDNCKINDHEKRFMGFSGTFQGIFSKLSLVVHLSWKNVSSVSDYKWLIH